MNSRSKEPPHILILGGGYAGLLAASNVRRELPKARITLVDGQENFSHRVRWHEALVGKTVETINYQNFSTEREIEFLKARVDKLEPEENRVHLTAGNANLCLDYDQLVYTLGSVSIPLWKEQGPDNVYALNNANELLEAQQRMAKIRRLVVIGSGLSAIEYATEVAENFPLLQIKLLTRSTLLSGYSRAAQNYARTTMAEMGIDVIEHMEIVSLDADHCVSENGDLTPFDICLCSAGFSASPVWRNSNLPSRGNGQIAVDGFMRAMSHGNVWVAGDAAYGVADGQATLRMSCASACATAPLMALNIARQQRDEELILHTPFYFCHCISFGRSRALIQMVTPDDNMLPTVVTGEVALATKIQISDAVISTLLWDGKSSQQGWWPDFEEVLRAAA